MNKKAAQFRVIAGGPLEVTGEFHITGKDGRVIEMNSPVYLCRCGGSGNKPLCDGSHNTNDFES